MRERDRRRRVVQGATRGYPRNSASRSLVRCHRAAIVIAEFFAASKRLTGPRARGARAAVKPQAKGRAGRSISSVSWDVHFRIVRRAGIRSRDNPRAARDRGPHDHGARLGFRATAATSGRRQKVRVFASSFPLVTPKVIASDYIGGRLAPENPEHPLVRIPDARSSSPSTPRRRCTARGEARRGSAQERRGRPRSNARHYREATRALGLKHQPDRRVVQPGSSSLRRGSPRATMPNPAGTRGRPQPAG